MKRLQVASLLALVLCALAAASVEDHEQLDFGVVHEQRSLGDNETSTEATATSTSNANATTSPTTNVDEDVEEEIPNEEAEASQLVMEDEEEEEQEEQEQEESGETEKSSTKDEYDSKDVKSIDEDEDKGTYWMEMYCSIDVCTYDLR